MRSTPRSTSSRPRTSAESHQLDARSYGLGATLGPLLVTALLAAGAGWRTALSSMAALVAATAVVAAVARHSWNVPPASPSVTEQVSHTPRRPTILPSVLFAAVETGVESAAGIWGYAFLTSGRGLSPVAAGIVVSAYWAMMFVGGLQVAASAVGSVALPSGVGLAVGAFGGSAVGPSLLTLSLAMCAVYWAALR